MAKLSCKEKSIAATMINVMTRIMRGSPEEVYRVKLRQGNWFSCLCLNPRRNKGRGSTQVSTEPDIDVLEYSVGDFTCAAIDYPEYFFDACYHKYLEDYGKAWNIQYSDVIKNGRPLDNQG